MKALSSLSNLKISTRIAGLAGILLAVGLAIAAVGAIQMGQIGDELATISEEDIPLTRGLTNVTLHQLEQTIAMERALRYGEEMQSHREAVAHFNESRKHFTELAQKVDAELIELEHMAEAGAEHAHTDDVRAEF